MQQNSYSIFWFTAKDLDSLQSWYNRASLCIAPDKYNDFARNHYRAVTQWLLNPTNGKWILIFDNANPDLKFGNILPANVPWGKIMFTSRTKEISGEIKQQSYEPVSIHMPLLARDEALALFMSRCANLKLTRAETLEVYRFSSSLRYSPLALTLASTHFQMYQRVSDLTSAYRDSSDNSEILIQRLTLLLIEDSRMNQRILLWFFYLLGRSSVSLNLVNVCQRSRGRLRNLQATTDFLRTSNTGSAISHWVSVGFLQRQTSPSGPIFHIPCSVQNTIEQDLANDREQSENTLQLGIRLVAAIHDGNGLQSVEDVTKCIDTTVAGFRNLCIAARDMAIILPDDTGAYSQRAALYYIAKTVEEGRILFKRLFWRQWRSLFQYSKPSCPAGEENVVIAVPTFSFPDWLETQIQRNYDLEDLGNEAVVRDALLAKLWNDLKLAILLSGMGSAWHGIREHVFDFARRKFHPDFSESQKTSFLDFVDKGGAEGLHSALLKVRDTGDFQQEATGRINSEAMDDMVRTICALSNPYMLVLSEEAIRQAIFKSLEGTMYDVFIEATGAMHDTLFSLQQVVEAVLEGPLGLPSEGEGARQMVHFVVSTMGETHLRQRCLTMTEGFCEYLDTAKVWIIANTCLHLAHTVLEETMSVQDFDWDWMCAIVEFVREGVMPVEKTPGRTGEVAGRRMLYWLEEACNCRSAWGARQDVPFYDFRNQVQWEESCVLMGAESRSWILS